MNKAFYIASILILFCLFFISEQYRKAAYTVLKVNLANEIIVDLNDNKTEDTNEKICIPNINVFTSKLSGDNELLRNKLNISSEDAVKIGYLTDIFAENLLIDKKVKVKFNNNSNQNCRFADIIVNNESYSEKLISSGFGIKEFKPDNKFKEQLEKAGKLKLVILNHKSNKFHKLDCEYGKTAHDIVILPEQHIPADAKPCKYCHITKVSEQNTGLNKNTFPLIKSNGFIKMFLTDLSVTLKPDRTCSSVVCKELVNQINNAKSTIDIALYGYDNVPDVFNALKNAKQRGVKIRIVYDISNNSYYPDTKNILNIADVISGDEPKFLMHNKFMIFDDKSVITGSMNFSQTGLSGFNSNCIFLINSKEIAEIYEKEFTQMINGKFHNRKLKSKINMIQIGESQITPLFSPQDKIITSNIVPLINSAEKYIYIPAFVITHEKLSNSLISARNRGVDIKIIIDATSTNSMHSKFKVLKENNIPIKVENFAGKIHSKSIIIDDKYIIAGSMNFSNSGENKNDENILIIKDSNFAEYYRKFFIYLWNKIPEKYLNHTVKPEGKYSVGSCHDGVDNDFDGKIDYNDDDCR